MRKPIGRPLLRLRSGTMRPRARNLPVVDGVSMGSPAAGTFGDLRLVVGREPFDDLSVCVAIRWMLSFTDGHLVLVQLHPLRLDIVSSFVKNF